MNDQTKPPFLTRAHLYAAVFFGLFLFLLYQAGRLLAPFFSALLWAAIITLALYPLHRRLLALVRGRKGLAAGTMTAMTSLLIIGPSIAVLAALATQAVDLFHWAAEFVKSERPAEIWSHLLNSPLGSVLSLPAVQDFDLRGFFMDHLGRMSSGIAVHIGGILKNTVMLVVNLVIMIVALFFFFRDGESHYRTVSSLFPFSDEQKLSITAKFMDTFNAVIAGLFLIALIQGILTAVGLVIFGIPFPVLWGGLAAFLALLPVGGAALVWAPAALYLLVTDATLKGILLMLWGILLVSTPDNVLKPLIIGKKAKIPTFFLFIAILGGIKAYGVLGILFGPVVVTLLTAAVQIYREEFANK